MSEHYDECISHVCDCICDILTKVYNRARYEAGDDVRAAFHKYYGKQIEDLMGETTDLVLVLQTAAWGNV